MTHLLILGAQGQVGNALAARARAAGLSLRRTHARRLRHHRPGRGGARRRRPAASWSIARPTRRSTAPRPKPPPPMRSMRPAPGMSPPPARKPVSPWFICRPTTSSTAKAGRPCGRMIRRGRSASTAAASSPARSRCGISHRAHVILRTSWVFSAHGQNFVKTMLRLAQARSQLRVVDDQIGGPTAADDIAQAILAVVAIASRPGFAGWGTYHFSGAPPVSWCAFARAILANRGVEVVPIVTADYPLPARRPMNSVLDCSRIFAGVRNQAAGLASCIVQGDR